MLVTPGSRRSASVVALLALGVFVALAIVVFHSTTTAFDTWVHGELVAHLGPTAAAATLAATSPAISVGVLAVAALVAGLCRRWNVVVLCVATPLVAVALVTYVAKPIIGRHIGDAVYSGDNAHAVSLAFPSGHETVVVTTATIVLVLALRSRLPAAVTAGLAVLLAGWAVAAAVGLVRNDWHYCTDTLGAAGLSVALVLGAALAIDRVTGAVRTSVRPAPDRQLTPRP